MVAIPLAVASDPARSELVNGPRLINVYAEKSPEGSETPFAIYRAPGLTSFYTGSGALSRGLFPLINVDGVDSLLSLHGSTLLSIDSDGVATTEGNVFGSGEVIFARNMKATPQVAIVAINEGAFILESGSVSQISDADLPTPNSVGFLHGYFLFGIDDGRFFGTSINEGTEINALDFATAEGHPDGLRRLYVYAEQVFLFGTNSIEIWVYNDRLDFPFEKLKGAVINIGLCAREAVATVSGRLYWVDDTGIVRRLDQGYTPVRISNVGVEKDIQELLADDDHAGHIHVWGYLDGGHEFVVISSDHWTWIWDNVLQVWHERKTHRYDYWQARHYAHCFGKHLVASSIQGGIFEIDKNAFDEDGTDIVCTVRTPIVRGFPNGAAIHEVNVLMETGGGLGASGASEDQNPTLMMCMTKDGYKTWTTERHRSIGTEGEYRKTIRYNRCGSVGRQGAAFEFSWSAAVATAMIEADAVGDPRKS